MITEVNEIYLLTGATGLLGSNILAQLIEKEKKIRILVLPNDKVKTRIPEGVEIVEGNLIDDESIKLFFTVPQNTDIIVIHAASMVTTDPNPNERVFSINVEGTKNIIKNCIRHKVKKLVYVSSTGAIPELPKGEVIREIVHHDPDKVIGYYSKTKAIATELVLEAVKNNDLNASVIYPSGIIGPNDYGYGLITGVIKMMAEGKLPVSFEGVFNSVDVRDLARGVITCAEKGQKGETYIMASRCYTFTELINTVCEEAGVKKPRIFIPLWLMRPFASIGTFYGKISKKSVLFTRFIVYNLERNNNFSTEKATTTLDFNCRPLNETIADTIHWLKEEGNLKG